MIDKHEATANNCTTLAAEDMRARLAKYEDADGNPISGGIERPAMQSTPFVSSTGESRNPIYEGQFDGETPEQAAHRLHWAKVAMELARDVAASRASEQALSADAMADRFISWPLPDSVRPDPCAMNPEYPHRYGTNLLTWAQAKAMFEYVMAAPAPAPRA